MEVSPTAWLRQRLTTGLVDVGIWALATVGAYLLRFDGQMPPVSQVFATFLSFTALKLLASSFFGLHRQSWRKFSFLDSRSVLLTTGTAALVATVLVAAIPLDLMPVGIPAIDGLLSLTLMLGARGFVRSYDDGHFRRAAGGRRHRDVLLVGAGEAGAILVREMLRHPETGMRPVGFLDDDPLKIGRSIAGVPVLGGLSALGAAVAKHGVDEVLICIPSADGRAIRNVVDRVRSVAPTVVCRTMPALHEVLSGQVQINRIRDVTIDDLLRRPTVELDADGVLGYLRGKRVLVTGAGGSIGSELVRQICRFEPGELVLFGHGENSIYQLERELDVQWPGIRYVSVIAQVQNVVRLQNVFETFRPEVVFHTAAHKHVPLMEQNPEEAVFNNVVGSRNLVEMAIKFGVTHFVNISTDKAVNPTSVMGATKRIVEMLVEEASQRSGPNQVFVSVRFGNVLGSRGSAVPIFKRQIAAGGPVTVTHPDMVRYFMTIPEAARLVLQASAHGLNGDIYILDMGEPVKVLDLVKDLIRLSGLEPDIDIPIVFTGTRPGEKLYEELMTERESASRTAHEKIFVARPQPIDSEALEETVDGLVDAALRSDGDDIRLILARRIPGARLQLRDGRLTQGDEPLLA
ncbi:MAG TPA: nucleoside-diphosphate sugar epimerase/dehydratase [Ilumatobacteraceae bacterium]|nr:nucleoside-diphosphate sugar epimerase/dehydratase [Ilumatobacteraceae bacterium]